MIDTYAIAVDGIGFDPSYVATMGIGKLIVDIIITPTEPRSSTIAGGFGNPGGRDKWYSRLKGVEPHKITIRVSYDGATTEHSYTTSSKLAIVSARMIASVVKKLPSVSAAHVPSNIVVRGSVR